VRLAHTCDSLSESLRCHLCRRHRHLSVHSTVGCKSVDEFVLLAYLDEMVRCVRKPRSLLRAGIRFRRAALWASKRIVKNWKCWTCAVGGGAGRRYGSVRERKSLNPIAEAIRTTQLFVESPVCSPLSARRWANRVTTRPQSSRLGMKNHSETGSGVPDQLQ
jgi:hypothetical protein